MRTLVSSLPDFEDLSNRLMSKRLQILETLIKLSTISASVAKKCGM
jgi:hypothetical protein